MTKSSISSSNSFQLDKTFWEAVSAAVEPRMFAMVKLGDWPGDSDLAINCNRGWYAQPLIGLDLIGLALIGLDLICLVLIGYQY